MADTNTPQIEVTPATGTPEYKAPATQEELDRIIESRLNRERAKYPNYEEYKAKAAEGSPPRVRGIPPKGSG